jgi:hypothetical protein
MTGKLEEKVSKITLTTTAPTTDNVYVKRGRGRPKGAKNKVKALVVVTDLGTDQQVVVRRGRGRPKGAKNKPKPIEADGELLTVKYKNKDEGASLGKKRGRPKKVQTEEIETSPAAKASTTVAEESLDNHPLFHAAKWLEKNMHQTELDYCRRRASRNSVSLHNTIVADILGFFNVQNAEICKQVKKTNFIVSNSNGLPN